MLSSFHPNGDPVNYVAGGVGSAGSAIFAIAEPSGISTLIGAVGVILVPVLIAWGNTAIKSWMGVPRIEQENDELKVKIHDMEIRLQVRKALDEESTIDHAPGAEFGK